MVIFREILENCPVIAAVKDEQSLERLSEFDGELVFLLFGDIMNISVLVSRIKAFKKRVIVHIDLIDGLTPKEIAVRFLKETTGADGIISTKPGLLRAAKDMGLIAVQRFFVIDSLSLEAMKKHINDCVPDAIEILPGILPRVIEELVSFTSIPVIAGGLIRSKADIMAVLGAGAYAVSTTHAEFK